MPQHQRRDYSQGAAQIASQGAPSATQPMENPIPMKMPSRPAQQEEKSGASKHTNKSWMIGLVIIVILLLGLAAYFCMKRKEGSSAKYFY
jgi:hypothetical protein